MKYEERLKVLELQKLEQRRERGDLIQFFKFNNKMDEINWTKPLKKMGATMTTGPAFGLRGQIRSRLDFVLKDRKTI